MSDQRGKLCQIYSLLIWTNNIFIQLNGGVHFWMTL